MTMSNTELTEFVQVHNAAIARHEQWLAEQEAAKTRHDQDMEDFRRRLQQTENLLNFNAEQLNTLTAGLLELRGMVADYIQGRSQTQ